MKASAGVLRLLWIAVPALLLTLLPAALVREEARQVRYEELAESVRGPYWLEHRLVYDGASTNVGWYAFLLVVYRLFGFGLTTAKWARVVLFCVSLLALSTLLHRWMRPLPATAALVAFAASPTLLFLNRLTTSYGTDLLFLVFCLLLLDSLWRRSQAPRSRGSPALAAALGAVSMLGAMTYPAFLPALPFLAGWLVAAAPARDRIRHAAAAATGFLLPLVAATFAVRNRATLLWDPVERAGVFRGGGVGWVADWSALRSNLDRVARDLFSGGASYYFELRSVEFGGWLGRAGFAAVLLLAAATAWKLRGTRAVLATAAGAALLAALATGAAAGPPGLRRATLVIAAFYLALAVVWAARTRLTSRPWARAAIAGALVLLPLHHGVAFADQLRQSRQAVWGRERVWFAVAPTPRRALDRWLEHVEAGHPLDCAGLDTPGRQTCRYDYIHAALAGARAWNGHPPIEIRAVDPRTREVVVLDPAAWLERPIPPVGSHRRYREP